MAMVLLPVLPWLAGAQGPPTSLQQRQELNLEEAWNAADVQTLVS